jgi:hypothetical protein
MQENGVHGCRRCADDAYEGNGEHRTSRNGQSEPARKGSAAKQSVVGWRHNPAKQYHDGQAYLINEHPGHPHTFTMVKAIRGMLRQPSL